MAALAPSPTAPGSVGSYAIVRPIGSTALDVDAFIGRSSKNGELCIVERLLRARATDEDFEAFARRAASIATLGQRGVPRVREILHTEDQIAVVSEFIEGERLEHLDALAAASDTPLSFAARLRLLIEVLSALAALHALRSAPPSFTPNALAPDRSGEREALGVPTPRADVRLFHGEIAPASIVVGLDGAARIVRNHRKPLPTKARTGIVDAQSGYSAPEILLGDAAADTRADVYSLGVLLWETLGGKRLFTQGTLAEMLSRQLAGDLPAASIPRGAPWAEPLVAIASTALAVDPNARFSSVTAMAAAMRDVAGKHLPTPRELSTTVQAIAGEPIARRMANLAATPSSDAPPRESRVLASGVRAKPPPPAAGPPRAPARPEAPRPKPAIPPSPPRAASPVERAPAPPPAGPAVEPLELDAIEEVEAIEVAAPAPAEGATTAVLPTVDIPPEAIKTQTMAAVAPFDPLAQPLLPASEPLVPAAMVFPPAAMAPERPDAPAPPPALEPEPKPEPSEPAVFAAPLGEPPEAQRRRRLAVVFAVLGMCVVVMLGAGIRALLRARSSGDTLVATDPAGSTRERAPDPPPARATASVAAPAIALPKTPLQEPVVPATEALPAPSAMEPEPPPAAEASAPPSSPSPAKPIPPRPTPRPRSTYEPMGI